MTRADVCLDPTCRWMRTRPDGTPPPWCCPRCGGPLLVPARRPTLVGLVRRYDPIGDAT